MRVWYANPIEQLCNTSKVSTIKVEFSGEETKSHSEDFSCPRSQGLDGGNQDWNSHLSFPSFFFFIIICFFVFLQAANASSNQ